MKIVTEGKDQDIAKADLCKCKGHVEQKEKEKGNDLLIRLFSNRRLGFVEEPCQRLVYGGEDCCPTTSAKDPPLKVSLIFNFSLTHIEPPFLCK
jgi:hypothetical protein